MTKTRKILILVSVIVLFVIITVAVITLNKPAEAVPTAASHISLAENYLLDLNYEAAIAEYRAAIQIDPKNADYYIALAEVYIEMGDEEAAVEVLEEGLEAVEEPDRSGIRNRLTLLRPIEETSETVQTTVTENIVTATDFNLITDNILGKPLTEAENYLNEIGLNVYVQETYSYEHDQGIVYDAVVNEVDAFITVSTIPPSYDVPNLYELLPLYRGTDADEALKQLTDLGFMIYKSYEYNAIYDKNIVIECSADNDTLGDAYVNSENGLYGYDDPIYITISAGQSPNSDDFDVVPDVMYKSFDEAKSILEDLGYVVLKKEWHSSTSTGTVYDMRPSLGAYVNERVVELTVSVGTNASEFIFEEFNALVPKGEIIQGTSFIYVSAGPDPYYNPQEDVILPDVTGMRYDEAQKLLEQAGFFVEIAGLDIYNEPQYDNDIVLSMFPRHGSYHDDKDFEIMLYLYEHG